MSSLVLMVDEVDAQHGTMKHDNKCYRIWLMSMVDKVKYDGW